MSQRERILIDHHVTILQFDRRRRALLNSACLPCFMRPDVRCGRRRSIGQAVLLSAVVGIGNRRSIVAGTEHPVRLRRLFL